MTYPVIDLLWKIFLTLLMLTIMGEMRLNSAGDNLDKRLSISWGLLVMEAVGVVIAIAIVALFISTGDVLIGTSCGTVVLAWSYSVKRRVENIAKIRQSIANIGTGE